MWYEIIPTLVIVGGGVMLSSIVTPYVQQLCQCRNRREIKSKTGQYLIIRDMVLVGNPHNAVTLGMDKLPDE